MSQKTKIVIGVIVGTAFAALAINLIFFDKGPQPPVFKPSPNVVEITEQNFQTEVIDAKIPVVIDFNATWCGPCQKYAPTFHKVADEYAGKVKFVSVDVDKAPAVAALFGVTSIPATLFLSEKDGVISAGGAAGALDEQTLKTLLDYCLQPDAELLPIFRRRTPADNTDPNAPKDQTPASKEPNASPNGQNVMPAKPGGPNAPALVPPIPGTGLNLTEPKFDTNPRPAPKPRGSFDLDSLDDLDGGADDNFPRVDPLPLDDEFPAKEQRAPSA